MFGGPVFHFELVRIARRWQFYALRGGFGLILLVILGYYFLAFWYGEVYWLNQRQTLTLNEMATYGAWVFGTLMAAQTGLVLLLTPALAAGAIVDERRRKTLGYILSSRLTSPEIVLGKLAARLLNVAVFMAIALPIVSLLTLLGGVDPVLLVMVDAGTLSSAFFVASMGLLVSILAGRVREAVVLAYALEGLWLFGPGLVRAFTPGGAWWLEINAWFEAASPLGLFMAIFRPGRFLEQFLWMVGLQVGAGLVLTSLSILLLRPTFKAHEGRSLGRRSLLRWQFRVFPRPAVGEDAVLWKEVHVARTAGIIRLLLLVLTIGLGVWIGYWTVVLAGEAFREAWNNGFIPGGDWRNQQHRSNFNTFLRFIGCGLGAVWMLALGGSAASRFSSEREQDTWTSLLATPLSGHEIVRGKMLGTLWATSWLGIVIAVHWLLGLLSGAIHPVWLLLATLELAVGAWYALALGSFISLLSKSTWRAQALTLGILLAPNMCCTLQVLPSPVMQVAVSLMGYDDSRSFLQELVLSATRTNGPPNGPFGDWEFWLMLAIIGAFIAGFALHAVAAYLLTFGTFRRFDAVADRPRRLLGQPEPLDPQKALVAEDEAEVT